MKGPGEGLSVGLSVKGVEKALLVADSEKCLLVTGTLSVNGSGGVFPVLTSRSFFTLKDVNLHLLSSKFHLILNMLDILEGGGH